jgi:hypothetical protein
MQSLLIHHQFSFHGVFRQANGSNLNSQNRAAFVRAQ